MNAERELRYKAVDESVRSRSLDTASRIKFEESLPFRKFPAHRKQKNMPGYYWCATTNRHIPYESLLEMNVLVMLDFDPKVSDVFAQPFELTFRDSDGSSKKSLRHVPDFLVRKSSGRDRVIDVKPVRRADKPKTQKVFDLTRKACEEAGWGYEVMSEPDPAVFANVEWLSGFRRPPAILDKARNSMLEYASDPLGTPFGELVGRLAADCPKGYPEALYRPVVYHLLWERVLTADLSVPLSDTTTVRPRMIRAGTNGIGTSVNGRKP